MSLIKPGIDSRHIIRQAMNSKSLATLAEEEDTYQARNAKQTKSTQFARRSQFCPQDRGKYTDKSPEEIFERAAISTKKLQDGTLAISEYYKPDLWLTYEQLGIDEQKLVANVSKVLGTLYLNDSSLKSTGGIKVVQGDISIPADTKMEDMSSIKEVHGSIIVRADSKNEAQALLKKMKFKPNFVGGKVIVLPKKI